MRKFFFFLFTLSVFALSCTQNLDKDTDSPEADTVWNDPTFGPVSLSTPANNTLRKIISFKTPEISDCYIEFWKEENRSDLKKSQFSARSKEHEITLVFMEENSVYQYQIKDQNGKESAVMQFTTGSAPEELYEYLLKEEPEGNLSFDGYILYSNKEKDFMLMINHDAHVVWYEYFSPLRCPAFSFDKRTQTISFMHGTSGMKPCGSQLTCIDFYGNRLLDIHEENLKNPWMHHDIYRMKDGNWIYTHFVQREFDFSPLGVNKVMTVTGDGLTIINAKGETLWEWNCFDHLNPLEDPDILLTEPKVVKEDWMHTNSIVEDEEGNIYISSNRMKQMIKIKRTTGEVMWRLGYNGNVKIEGEKANELSPDRLHSLEFGKDGEIHLFENGDRNREYSRILSYKVNDADKTAQCLKAIMLPLDLRSHYNSNAYEVDENHYIVHSTAKVKTAIMDKSGKILWAKPIKGLSFRAIYLEPDLDRMSASGK